MELDLHLLMNRHIREDFLKEEGELVNMWNKYRITLFSGNENIFNNMIEKIKSLSKKRSLDLFYQFLITK